jgi:hypothetical protein
MFIAALFTIAKLWKQRRCPITDEWIKKMWYLCTMEFYSAMKKNEILSFAGKWMELENIILSSEDQNSYVLPHMQTLDLDKCISVVGLGSHDKGRAQTGDIEIGRKPQT